MTRLTPLSLLALALVGCSSGGSNEPSEDSVAELAVGGTYKLVTRVSGKCLDVNHSGTADGTKIQEWTCNGTGAQTFRVEDAGNGNVRFVNPQSGKCLDINGAGTADGTAVQLWTCNGTGAQSFHVQAVSSGSTYSRVVNTNSSKCVDVTGGATGDGTAVELWTCNGTNAQSWKLSLVSAPPPVDAGDGTDASDAASAVDANDGATTPDTGVDTGAPDTGVDTGTGSDPYAAARQACVDHINALRATLNLPPFARWTSNESCADGQCKSDSETGTAHGAFGQCPNWGQCECPGWGSVSDIVPGCLDAMWAEGPGGGHYDIMTSKSYTQVSCGFYVTPTGKVWAVQDYK